MTRTLTSRSLDRGLLVLRLAVGLVFVMHGWQKLTVFGHAGVAGMLASLGIPFPGLSAVLIIAAELGGGLALLLGAGTRFAAAVIGFSMLVAVATVHIRNGFFLPNGYEFALTMLLTNIAVIFTGAGVYSVDALVAGRRHTPATAPSVPSFKAAA